MKRRPVDQLVYECMLPRPKPSDPPNFHGILMRYLVFEVRQEVHSFYGHISTQEARYPGLDYCHRVHRIRLSRWPWHRRLFRAFDTLRLTPAEIANLTKWEGTKWAKERYEKEQGITIRDTSADGLPDWRAPGSRWCAEGGGSSEGVASDGTIDGSANAGGEAAPLAAAAAGGEKDNGQEPLAAAHDEDSDLEIQSIGLQLNERLLERVAAHNAGDTSQPLDEDWEQWLKNAIEAGNLTLITDHILRLASDGHASAASTASTTSTASTANTSANTNQNSHSTAPTATATVLAANDASQARLMDAARQGHWDEVPGLLRDVVRSSFGGERARRSVSPSTLSSQGSSTPQQPDPDTAQRRTYSSLRLPSGGR